jgi:hypothetical protein
MRRGCTAACSHTVTTVITAHQRNTWAADRSSGFGGPTPAPRDSRLSTRPRRAATPGRPVHHLTAQLRARRREPLPDQLIGPEMSTCRRQEHRPKRSGRLRRPLNGWPTSSRPTLEVCPATAEISHRRGRRPDDSLGLRRVTAPSELRGVPGGAHAIVVWTTAIDGRLHRVARVHDPRVV